MMFDFISTVTLTDVKSLSVEYVYFSVYVYYFFVLL